MIDKLKILLTKQFKTYNFALKQIKMKFIFNLFKNLIKNLIERITFYVLNKLRKQYKIMMRIIIDEVFFYRILKILKLR
jgi:hypothetical protein